MTNNEILESINDIDSVVLESEMNVIESMIDSYHKSLMILESYEGDNLDSFEIFNESFIMESDSNDSVDKKKKSIIRKMIDSLNSLFQTVLNFFKKIKNNVFKNKKASSDIQQLMDKVTDVNDTSQKTITINIDIQKLHKLVAKVISNDLVKNVTSEIEILGSASQINKTFEFNEDACINIIEHDLSLIKSEISKLNDTDNDTAKIKYFNLVALLNLYVKIFKYVKSIKTISSKHSKFSPEIEEIRSIINYANNSPIVQFKKDAENFDVIFKKFKNMCLDIRTTTDYERYKKLYSDIADIVGFNKRCIIKDGSLNYMNIKQSDYILIRTTSRPEAHKSTILPQGIKLYHSSDIGGITELKPTFRAGSLKDNIMPTADSMYPSKRIYFFLNKPGNRMSTSNSNFSDSDHIYEYTSSKPIRIKFDTEETSNSTSSVFIETDKPLPVKDVTDQFKSNKKE